MTRYCTQKKYALKEKTHGHTVLWVWGFYGDSSGFFCGYGMGTGIRGVARNLLREANQRVWGTEVLSGVQGRNMETLENTNGTVTKIDLR